MSETMPSSSSEYWLQYYHQATSRPVAPPLGGFSEATTVTTSVTADQTMSPTNSSTNGGGLNPKGNVSKPVRRRSRASRRTPTTLLNASTTNFRSLVQQFTGFSSGPSSSSFAPHRGPLNLNFGLESENRVLETTPMATSFGYYNSYNHQNQNHVKEDEYYQQAGQQGHIMYNQEQQSMFPLSNNNSRPNMQTFDDFVMDTNPLYANGVGHDGYFFGED